MALKKSDLYTCLWASWDQLRCGMNATIVHEVLSPRHGTKQCIPEGRCRKAPGWMRGKGFVPQGVS